jgi:hypothetical protein
VSFRRIFASSSSVRARVLGAAVALILLLAQGGCVGDDTVVSADTGAGPVQGGSGPPPSSYEDATLEDATLGAEGGEDAPPSTLDGSADSTTDGASRTGDAGAAADATDAAGDAASPDAGDGA